MAGIPPFPHFQSHSHLTSNSSNGPSSLQLSSPVERELCNFLQELNQTSSLGLTGSELVSLAKGNFVPSPSNFWVQGTARTPSRWTEGLLGADPSGVNCGNVGLNSIIQGTGLEHSDQGPTRACKSNGKQRATTERTLRLNTFSTAAGLKSECGGKNPKSLTCRHELFPQNDSTRNKNSIGQTSSLSSKSSGSGHQSKCQSSSEAGFQCRVIKLTQREHMILQRYEKVTKSIEKFNQVPAAKKNVQVFLLSRSQEVHVSGKDFEFARTKLLYLIRLSQVWWDRRRLKGPTVKLAPLKLKQFSHLNLPERLQKKMSLLSKLPAVQRGPKPADLYSMTKARTATSSVVEVISKQTSVGGIFQIFPHLCPYFPDCSNKSPNIKISKNCMQVQIKTEFLHNLFIEGDKTFGIMQQISLLLVEHNMDNVKVCLLRKASAFHVLSEDGKFLQPAIDYLSSLMQRCRTLANLKDEFEKKSENPPEVAQEPEPQPPPPPPPRPKTIYIPPLRDGEEPPPRFLTPPPPPPKVIDERLPFAKVNKPPPPPKVTQPPPKKSRQKRPPRSKRPPKVTQPPPKKSRQKRPPPSKRPSKVTQSPWKKSPQKRPPPPPTTTPGIPKRAIPVVSKPTPPKKPRLSRPEKRQRRNNVPYPNSQTSQPNPNHQRSWAWEQQRTPDVWQTDYNNNNFPPYPRNEVWMESPRMPFGQGPNFYGCSQDNNPWQPQGPPNPWQAQQQYPPYPPSQFDTGNNGYDLWIQAGQNNAFYPQSNNGFWL